MRDPNLISLGEIQKILGVSATRVYDLQARDKNFPPVEQYTPMGRLYSREKMLAYAATRQLKPGRAAIHDRIFFQRVAVIYRKAQHAGRPPTRAVAKELNGTYKQALRWVGQARALGLLEASGREKKNPEA